MRTSAGTILVWSLISLLTIPYFIGAAWSESTPTFSPDRTLLATGHKDGTVKLWKVATGAEEVTLYKPLDPDFFAVSALVWDPLMAFSPNGRFLATKRGDEPIFLWAMPTGKELVSLRGGGGCWCYEVFSRLHGVSCLEPSGQIQWPEYLGCLGCHHCQGKVENTKQPEGRFP